MFESLVRAMLRAVKFIRDFEKEIYVYLKKRSGHDLLIFVLKF